MPSHSPTEALLLDHQLCFALYSASLAMTKVYKPLLDELGLTYPQYLVLLVLWEQDDVQVSRIGERLHLDSGTLTPLLKRLEASQLVRRTRDCDDERRVRITLTEQGRALRMRAQQVPACMQSRSQLDLSQIAALRQQLQGLRAQLGAAATHDFNPPAQQAQP